MKKSIGLVLALAFISPGHAWAQAHPAADISFDDTNTTHVTGTDVQEALENADATLVDITNVDIDAPVVQLRNDCTNYRNCFETMASLSDPATGWIWNTRTPSPSATSPLVVEIAPGTYGGFSCDGGSYVTLRGAGREVSILSDARGVDVHLCDHLEFIDLGLRNSSAGSFPIFWDGGGSSVWSNVEVIAIGNQTGTPYGWWDACDPPAVKGNHYFHGSRISVDIGDANYNIGVGIISACSETVLWFYGGDILVSFDQDPTGIKKAIGITSQYGGDVRVFVSRVRVASTSSASGSGNTLTGLMNSGGAIHVHGSIVNVMASSSTSNQSVVGIDAAGGLTHAPETAFSLTGNGGPVDRIRKTGGASTTVISPYNWGASNFPPVASSETNILGSLKGEDMYVEKDCSSAGNCSSGGSETHLMIYNASCSASNPWFDVVTGACRQ